VNRQLPEGIVAYSTAFEVALHEMSLGRLSSEQVIRIGTKIMETEQADHLFPDFMYCPKDLTLRDAITESVSDELKQITQNVDEYIHSVCLSTLSDV
jgi:hypothetical protein